MEALDLLDCLNGDNIATRADSASQESQLVCQEGTGCDCKGCSDSG